VATDDERISDHCKRIGAPAVMTDPDLPSGSDRALAAMRHVAPNCDCIVNLQGDAPFTPVNYITAVADAVGEHDCDAATPCIQLDWSNLDTLREAKKQTPFSGTTCIADNEGRAVWFSKAVLPSIRNENALRAAAELSPVLRHVGLYGFTRSALEKFNTLPPSRYEKLEGLEQLRMIENGMIVRCVTVAPASISTPGVDTQEDLAQLNALIAEKGDPGIVW
jgi:3-deoxy-manno-octulosonate cytidylyltransferase (CMP-KDO synthetase)